MASKITVKDILDFMCEVAPPELALSWDNCGLIVGDPLRTVTRVICALDITPDVIEEARAFGAQLIISHHPVIFEGLMRVTAESSTGVRLMRLIENRIAAICMHTNLDICEGGVNDMLAGKLGLENVSVCPDTEGVCRMGTVPPQEAGTFARFVRERLGAGGVKLFINAEGGDVRRVAVGGGSCGGDIAAVKRAGCDTFVTSDVKHSHQLEAAELGLNLIDAGHFITEDVVIPKLVAGVSARFPALEVRKAQALRDRAIFVV